MNNKTETLLSGIIITVGVITLLAIVMAVPLMLLWGYLIPVLFPLAVTSGAIAGSLTFWQAFWLNFLCSILFKNTASNSSSK